MTLLLCPQRRPKVNCETSRHHRCFLLDSSCGSPPAGGEGFFLETADPADIPLHVPPEGPGLGGLMWHLSALPSYQITVLPSPCLKPLSVGPQTKSLSFSLALTLANCFMG